MYIFLLYISAAPLLGKLYIFYLYYFKVLIPYISVMYVGEAKKSINFN